MPALVFDVATFVAGVLVLIFGGDVMVRGAVRLAQRLGVSALIIGLTVVAFGTSAPELALNVIAANNGNARLSFGNVVGSNIANIGLILGLIALFKPLSVGVGVIRRELPIMVLATLAMAGLVIHEKQLDSLDGIALLVGFVMFTLGVLNQARRDREKAQEFEEEVKEIAGEEDGSLLVAVALFVVGLVMLLGGGWLAERGAVQIAVGLGMDQEIIGLTVVALATSLPELAASAMAVRRGHSDIAVGNIVGSNIFNLLLVFGATAGITAVPLPPETGLVSLGVLGFLTVIMVPVCLTSGRQVSRIEAAVLLVSYVGYIGWLVWQALDSRQTVGI
ncbi:MAG: calcium/sodium antiporter [Planctomycetota bacterium]